MGIYEQKLPSRLRYIVGAIAVVGGICGSIAVYVGGTVDLSDDLIFKPRIEVPSYQQLRLKAGDYEFLYPRRTSPNTLAISIITAGSSSSQPVEVKRAGSFKTRATVNGHNYVIAAKAKIPRTGTYIVATSDSNQSPSQPTEMILTQNFGGSVTTMVLLGLLILFAGLGLGLPLIIVTGVRRKRLRQS